MARRTAGGGITRNVATTITTTTLYVPDGQQEIAEYYRVSPNAPPLSANTSTPTTSTSRF